MFLLCHLLAVWPWRRIIVIPTSQSYCRGWWDQSWRVFPIKGFSSICCYPFSYYAPLFHPFVSVMGRVCLQMIPVFSRLSRSDRQRQDPCPTPLGDCQLGHLRLYPSADLRDSPSVFSAPEISGSQKWDLYLAPIPLPWPACSIIASILVGQFHEEVESVH